MIAMEWFYSSTDEDIINEASKYVYVVNDNAVHNNNSDVAFNAVPDLQLSESENWADVFDSNADLDDIQISQEAWAAIKKLHTNDETPQAAHNETHPESGSESLRMRSSQLGVRPHRLHVAANNTHRQRAAYIESFSDADDDDDDNESEELRHSLMQKSFKHQNEANRNFDGFGAAGAAQAVPSREINTQSHRAGAAEEPIASNTKQPEDCVSVRKQTQTRPSGSDKTPVNVGADERDEEGEEEQQAGDFKFIEILDKNYRVEHWLRSFSKMSTKLRLRETVIDEASLKAAFQEIVNFVKAGEFKILLPIRLSNAYKIHDSKNTWKFSNLANG